MTEIPPRRISRIYLAPLLVWIALIGFSVVVVIEHDLRTASERFTRQAANLYEYSNHQVAINATVLEGFTALLANLGDADRSTAVQYARQMLERFPHIFMFEIAGKVRRQNLKPFINLQRNSGLPGFEVKRFDYDGERNWLPLEKKPYYIPLLVMEPMPEASREVLGLDLDANEFFREALDKSIRLNTPVASRPFNLVEGQHAYIVVRPVEEIEGAGRPERCEFTEQRYGLLVIEAETLLPPTVQLPEDMGVSIWHTDYAQKENARLFHRQVKRRSLVEKLLFPRLQFERRVESPGHPFELRVAEQLGWNDLSLPLLLSLSGIGIFSFWLLLRYARWHHAHELARLQAENQLFYLANFDNLTRLPNRNLFEDRFEQALSYHLRDGGELALVLVDLDNFKACNNRLGHAGGDVLLREVAKRLTECTDKTATIARFGGDEFVILFDQMVDEAVMDKAIERVRGCFVTPFRVQETVIQLSANIGVARYPNDGRDLQQLLKHADNQLFALKLKRRTEPLGH